MPILYKSVRFVLFMKTSFNILTYGCVDCRAEQKWAPEIPLFDGRVRADPVGERIQYLPLILEQLSLHQGAPRILTNTDVPETITDKLLGGVTNTDVPKTITDQLLGYITRFIPNICVLINYF